MVPPARARDDRGELLGHVEPGLGVGDAVPEVVLEDEVVEVVVGGVGGLVGESFDDVASAVSGPGGTGRRRGGASVSGAMPGGAPGVEVVEDRLDAGHGQTGRVPPVEVQAGALQPGLRSTCPTAAAGAAAAAAWAARSTAGSRRTGRRRSTGSSPQHASSAGTKSSIRRPLVVTSVPHAIVLLGRPPDAEADRQPAAGQQVDRRQPPGQLPPASGCRRRGSTCPSRAWSRPRRHGRQQLGRCQHAAVLRRDGGAGPTGVAAAAARAARGSGPAPTGSCSRAASARSQNSRSDVDGQPGPELRQAQADAGHADPVRRREATQAMALASTRRNDGSA